MLVANQQLIALGRQKYGQPHKFHFTLTNPSDKSIRIDNISVGCGSCTQAQTEKSVVEAGGTTKIDVTFTPNSTGIQSKSITVSYGSGHLKLNFTAEVV